MNKAGIWIDRAHAIVVMVNDAGETVKEFSTENSESQLGGEEQSKPEYTRNDFVAEDKLERKQAIARKEMYDAVLAHLGDADMLYILGPGEAKQEFNHQLTSKHSRKIEIALETAGKMTNPQLCAKVREHFKMP